MLAVTFIRVKNKSYFILIIKHELCNVCDVKRIVHPKMKMLSLIMNYANIVGFFSTVEHVLLS